MEIGKTIKRCRELAGLSLSELSHLTDLSIAYLCLIEKDKRSPGVDILAKIAHALDVPLGVIMFLSSAAGDLSLIEKDQFDNLSRHMEQLMIDAFSLQTAMDF